MLPAKNAVFTPDQPVHWNTPRDIGIVVWIVSTIQSKITTHDGQSLGYDIITTSIPRVNL